MQLLDAQRDLRTYARPDKAEGAKRFFKTGKGQYGEGDEFIGVTVPETRLVAKKHHQLGLVEIEHLLKSRIHEDRLLALLILVSQYKKNKSLRSKIFTFYLSNMRSINNWDLVDTSADKIVGDFLLSNGDTSFLKKLAQSSNLWERRVAIVSTFAHIRAKSYGTTLHISDLLMHDAHDLIHKAVGWMLREVGKRNKGVLETYLLERYKSMPRTMLRYAIERFPEQERRNYLTGLI